MPGDKAYGNIRTQSRAYGRRMIVPAHSTIDLGMLGMSRN